VSGDKDNKRRSAGSGPTNRHVAARREDLGLTLREVADRAGLLR